MHMICTCRKCVDFKESKLVLPPCLHLFSISHYCAPLQPGELVQNSESRTPSLKHAMWGTVRVSHGASSTQQVERDKYLNKNLGPQKES